MKKLLAVAAVCAIVLVAGCAKKTIPSTGADQGASGVQTNQAPAAPKETGPPTIVEDGKSIEDHVIAYFEAYKDQRLEDAFELQPAENKTKQPKDQFVPLRKGMPITDYTIHPTSENGDQSVIEVEYVLEQYGTWVSTWTFEKQGDGWVAVRYLASPKQ